MSNLLKYAKALVAALTPAYLLFEGAQSDGVITGAEWRDVAIAVIVALGVFLVPNRDAARADRRTNRPAALYDQDTAESPMHVEQEPRHGRHLP